MTDETHAINGGQASQPWPVAAYFRFPVHFRTLGPLGCVALPPQYYRTPPSLCARPAERNIAAAPKWGQTGSLTNTHLRRLRNAAKSVCFWLAAGGFGQCVGVWRDIACPAQKLGLSWRVAWRDEMGMRDQFGEPPKRGRALSGATHSTLKVASQPRQLPVEKAFRPVDCQRRID